MRRNVIARRASITLRLTREENTTMHKSINAVPTPGQKHIPRSREALEYTRIAGLRAQAELADFESDSMAKLATLETSLTTGLMLEILLDIRDVLLDYAKRAALETPRS